MEFNTCVFDHLGETLTKNLSQNLDILYISLFVLLGELFSILLLMMTSLDICDAVIDSP